MRKFVDANGQSWDVVVGRESWGGLLALFVPAGNGVARQAGLRAESLDKAEQELEALDDGALNELLNRSKVKDA